MIRIIAPGLLIVGIMPRVLANSAVTSTDNMNQLVPEVKVQADNLLVDSSCTIESLSNNCFDPTATVKNSTIQGNLWLEKIANSFLADSFLLACGQRSLKRTVSIAQFDKIEVAPTLWNQSAKEKCSFSWQKKLDRELNNSKSVNPIKLETENHNVENYHSPSKFPHLSRSSLIVSFPQENSSFVPINTKLTNPAPETKRIASPFGWRVRPYSNQQQFHQGIDYGAPYGSPVVAVDNGIVTKIVSGCSDFGNLSCGGQLGNWIEIDHGNGKIGTYGHLKSSSITVKEGMKVGKNQNIAQVGSSGWSTGAHLDFRLKVDGQHEDPAKYVMTIKQNKVNLAN